MPRRLPKRSAPPVVRDRPSRRLPGWLLIVAVGVVVYANALGAPFLLDDHRTIDENASIRSLSSIGAVLHPPTQSPVTGRPLVNLSFALNYALGGLRVEGFHATNIAVHILAALVLFGVLRATFAQEQRVGRAFMARQANLKGSPYAFALTCALVWLVHPLNTETVNYVTQRTESLMGLFYLLALYAAIRALEASSARRWEWLACAAAFCAVGSKETALTLPIVILLWDRAFAFDSVREAWAARWRVYARVAASGLLFAVFARELPFFTERGFEEQVSRWTYLLNQAPMIVQYLKLSLWPVGLVFDYGTPQPLALGTVWPFALVVLALLAATAIALIRWPSLGFWGAWFFITLAPASSIIPIPTEVGAERRMYLPLIAVIALLAIGVHRLMFVVARQRVPPKHQVAETDALLLQQRRTRIATAVAALVLAGLATMTVVRNREYQNPLRLWETVLERRPHARAHEHLSMSLRDAGRTDDAIAHLEIAAPESPNARHALASALLDRGDVAGSIAQFRQFVTENPGSLRIIPAREEFGVALLRANDPAGAAEQFREITRANPQYARGYVGLADALLQVNDTPGAIEAYRQAIRLQPDNVVALANLGLLLAGRGENAEAMAVLRKALTIEPRALAPRKQLARLLLAQGLYDEMAREAGTLASMAPNDPDAHNLFGVALASQQRFGPAREQFEQALRLDPGNQDAQRNLARVRALAPRALAPE